MIEKYVWYFLMELLNIIEVLIIFSFSNENSVILSVFKPRMSNLSWTLSCFMDKKYLSLGKDRWCLLRFIHKPYFIRIKKILMRFSLLCVCSKWRWSEGQGEWRKTKRERERESGKLTGEVTKVIRSLNIWTDLCLHTNPCLST